MNPVPFTWVFRIKHFPGSVPILYNAICCLLSDKQRPIAIYPEALYAPVVLHETIWILLSKVDAQNLIFEGSDISNAYLCVDLESPVVLHLPTYSSFISSKPNHVALVVKSLYVHRSGGQLWGNLLHGGVTAWVFKQLSIYYLIYFLKPLVGFFILVIVVNYICILSNSSNLIQGIKDLLFEEFQVKHLGSMRVFIGWKINRTPSFISP